MVYYITDAEKTFNLTNPGPPSAYPSNGCVLNVQGDHAYVVPVILLISDSIKVILALIPTLRMMCEGTISSSSCFQSLPMNEVYREGVLFYVYLCIYTVVELVLVIQSADNAIAIVPIFLVTRVVLASRMVLHVRHLYTVEEFTAQATGLIGGTRSCCNYGNY
ncbi:hypothetical protein Ac2012v2_003816 [Leucoagaricus gongylophorus]